MPKTRILKARPATATALATALCAVGAFAPVAADAGSPVDPPHVFVFVVDNGVCAFPVQWEGTTRGHEIMSTTPGWTLTLTNMDTGSTWSPAGNGTISFQDLPNDTTIQTLNGVNYAPRLEEQLVGHWTRTLSEEGASEFVGSGKVVSICDMLS